MPFIPISAPLLNKDLLQEVDAKIICADLLSKYAHIKEVNFLRLVSISICIAMSHTVQKILEADSIIARLPCMRTKS